MMVKFNLNLGKYPFNFPRFRSHFGGLNWRKPLIGGRTGCLFTAEKLSQSGKAPNYRTGSFPQRWENNSAQRMKWCSITRPNQQGPEAPYHPQVSLVKKCQPVNLAKKGGEKEPLNGPEKDHLGSPNSGNRLFPTLGNGPIPRPIWPSVSALGPETPPKNSGRVNLSWNRIRNWPEPVIIPR